MQVSQYFIPECYQPCTRKFCQLSRTYNVDQTVKPVYNDHPRDPNFVAIVDRVPLFRGRFIFLKEKIGPQNVVVVSRWYHSEVVRRFDFNYLQLIKLSSYYIRRHFVHLSQSWNQFKILLVYNCNTIMSKTKFVSQLTNVFVANFKVSDELRWTQKMAKFWMLLLLWGSLFYLYLCCIS